MKKSKPAESKTDKKIDLPRIGFIMESLNFLPPELTEIDLKNKFIIAKTISVLPEKVQVRVIDEVVFIGLEGGSGQYEQVLLKSTKKNGLIPIIFLDFSGMKSSSENYKMTVIAHEIAHFILGHEASDGGTKIEKATDNLCEEWGFGRAYKSYDEL